MYICKECECKKKPEVDKEEMERNYSQSWVANEDEQYIEGTVKVDVRGQIE